jgi:HTH-type transcriptional regulator/antitoxin MqsA
MNETHQCMSCGYQGMVREENRCEVISHDGEQVTVTELVGWFCPDCNDGFFDDDSSRRCGETGDELIQRVRERQTLEVRRIRKKLGLSQKDAAAIFGGGVNAFSRYERGEIEPHTSTRKLLKLLDKHPELLKEVVNS